MSLQRFLAGKVHPILGPVKTGMRDGMIDASMKAPLFANKRLLAALACYAVLALIGALALDGILRAAVLCFFAILTVKTLIHAQKDDEMP